MKIKHGILILPFFLIVILTYFFWRGLHLEPNLIASPLLHKKSPEFSLPNLLDKKKHTTDKDFLNHITIVNVWATWCTTCKNEHDFLLMKSKKTDFNLYGLNYKDDIAQAKFWLQQYGNPYKIVAFDQEGNVAIDWGVYGTPEIFILDKKACIRYKHIGVLTEKIWKKEIVPLINALKAESL